MVNVTSVDLRKYCLQVCFLGEAKQSADGLPSLLLSADGNVRLDTGVELYGASIVGDEELPCTRRWEFLPGLSHV